MENKGLVSVIVPIYNVENYLERCLNTIINQTYSELEIILVDDGSTDLSGEICEKWREIDTRIQVVHKKNAGLGFARNSGLEVATGEYVVFIDSDDYVALDYIERLIEPMLMYDVELSASGIIRKLNDGSEMHYPIVSENTIIYEDEILEKIMLPVLGAEEGAAEDVEREMSVCINMYRLDVIKNNDISFVSERDYVSEDVFFNMLYFLNIKRAALISECVYFYCTNGNSLTHTYREDRFEKYCKMLKRQLEILREHNIENVSQNRVYRTFLMKVKKTISQLSICNLSRKEKTQRCKDILESKELQQVVAVYGKNSNVTKKQKIILYLMKNKNAKILLSAYYCVYIMKNNRILGHIIKRIKKSR